MFTTDLMTLPTELHEIIIGYLDFPSTAYLKCANHYFNDLVKDIDYFEAEKSDYAKLNDLWACKECNSLLPSYLFSDKSKRENRSKTGSKASKRFCVLCGVAKNYYAPGNQIFHNGTLFLICKACLCFKEGQEKSSGLCKACGHEETMSEKIRKARLEAEALKERILRRKAEITMATPV